MSEIIFIQWVYKAIVAFFIVLFVRNTLDRNADIYSQIMNAFILIPFVLRLLSIR